MKRNVLTIAIIVLVVAGANGQGARFRIGAGYQRTSMVDEQASPLKYQSSEKTFLLNYLHEGKKGKLNAQLNGAFGNFFPTGFQNRVWYDPGYKNDGSAKKDSNLLIGQLYHANLNVGYAKKIGTGHFLGNEAVTKTYAGASLNDQLFYSDNIVRMGWLNAATVNADFSHSISYQTKHFFLLKVSIPIFGMNSRLPYHNTISSSTPEGNIKTFFKNGSRFAWLADFQNVQLSASYEYAVSKKLAFGVHYSGQWLRYIHEKPITLLQNNIGVLASFK
jgi:hypothetical protein